MTDWRAIFYINLPIGIIGYLAARLILPADKPLNGQETFDFNGALTLVLNYSPSKFGPVALTTSGLTIMGLGLLYFSTLSASANFYQVIPGSLLMGLGFGLFSSSP